MRVGKMLKQLLSAIFIMSVTMSISASGIDYMNVYLISESSYQSILIDNIDKITFTESDEAVITMSGVATSMPISNIDVITFGDADITSIEETQAEKIEIEIKYHSVGGELSITSGDAIDMVQIYNIQGAQMLLQTPNNQEVQIDINNYPKGVYIVAVQSGTQTITKKVIK